LRASYLFFEKTDAIFTMTPYSVSIAALLVLLTSCNRCHPGAGDAAHSALLGRWEIAHASRNGKPTETLTGVYFEFNADGKMLTNLPVGPETPVDYEVKGKELVQKNELPITYTIQSVSDSSLILNVDIRGMQFEMQLQRPVEIPEPEAPEEGTTHDSLNI
jgi:hypothetical protein